MALDEILVDRCRFDRALDNLNQRNDDHASLGLLLTEAKVLFQPGHIHIAHIHIRAFVDENEVTFRITRGSKSET